jgi:hypothetical protein
MWCDRVQEASRAIQARWSAVIEMFNAGQTAREVWESKLQALATTWEAYRQSCADDDASGQQAKVELVVAAFNTEQLALHARDQNGHQMLEAVFDLPKSCWNQLFEGLHPPSMFAEPSSSLTWGDPTPPATFFTTETLVLDFSGFGFGEYTVLVEVVRFLCTMQRTAPVHLLLPTWVHSRIFMSELGFWYI